MRQFILTLLILAAEPSSAQVLAENPPWKLSRVPDEKYGAGYGCRLTISADSAQMHLTAYFLGADVEIQADNLNLQPHKGTLNLYIPALDQTMMISGAVFEGKVISARGGEQVLMQMLEATAEAEADVIVVFDGDTQVGGFKAAGLSDLMPQMRACFQSL